MSDRVLQVEDLHVHFPLEHGRTVKAVRGVSFHIDRGETLAIVGESGSGKSVTAMSVMRLNDAMGALYPGGKITLTPPNEAPIDILSQTQRKMQDVRGDRVAMIFQEPMTSLNPVLRNGFQVTEAIMCHQEVGEEEAKKRAMELFDLVRIPEAGKRFQQYPHQLSGGMRQRVMIAMALSCRPSLLIADEPTTALDVTIQAQILGLIKQLQDEIGMSVLFITHDMGVVAEVADRVAVMLLGNKVEEGTADQIFHRPEHPYTQALLAAVPRLGSMRGKDAPEKFQGIEVKGTFAEMSEA